MTSLKPLGWTRATSEKRPNSTRSPQEETSSSTSSEVEVLHTASTPQGSVLQIRFAGEPDLLPSWVGSDPNVCLAVVCIL
mmetsp:Transcript_6856/g.14338  ORF Transcript_6856/g.14338 Transcript_6856/m.14338 type:complete len:80 (-) Transcript_6856:9-248(-)